MVHYKCKIKTVRIKKKNKKLWFYPFSITLLVLVLIFGGIYSVFNGDFFVSAGKNLTRKDWLAFIGNYLSFIGTVGVAVITLYQTYHYKRKDELQRRNERIKEIEPIFSLKIAEEEENSFKIKLRNVAPFPVRNVHLNNTFYYELLALNVEETISFYDKQSDFVADYGCNKYGYPNKIVINYEDIDGGLWYQEFIYKDDINCCDYGYYKLVEKENVMEGNI